MSKASLHRVTPTRSFITNSDILLFKYHVVLQYTFDKIHKSNV